MFLSEQFNFGLLETPKTSDSREATYQGASSSSVPGTSSQSSVPGTSFGQTPRTSSLSSGNSHSNSTQVSGLSSSSSSKRPRYNAGNSSTGSSVSSSSTPNVRSSTSRTSNPGSSTRTPRGFSSSGRTPGSRRTPYTGSSMTPGATPARIDRSALVAIVEGRGLARGEIGMATLDLKRPELVLSQFSDMLTYVKTITKLQIIHPLEIILPSTACESGTMTNLSKFITDQFHNTSISTVQRKYFNETKGLLYVKQLCVPEYSSVELEVSSKYYCLAAVAALMKYLEFIQNTIYAPASLKIVFKGSENTTMIDVSTAKNLELLQNQRDPHSDHTLYGILNYTKTVAGARLLRSNILQPPSDIDTITLRQDAVSELIEKPEIFYNLEAVIGRFLDIDHLLSLCVQVQKQENVKTAENKITNVMYLKHTLELVTPLKEALGDCENPLLMASYKVLEDPRFVLMLDKINCIIHEDARYQKGTLNMRSQKCFAVKPNMNGLLDISRKTYTEMVDDITDLVNQMAGAYNLPLKVAYSTTRGFHIQMYGGGAEGYTADNLPGIFMKVTKFKNTFSFTTADLIKMNGMLKYQKVLQKKFFKAYRVKESLHEIYMMTSIVMTELLNNIRDDIGALYKLTETVATIDMLLSFAHACTLSDFVRPEFTDTFAVKQSRHPILEKISIEHPVPNNIYASEDSNFVVITGPNMSGKSTYLRQIALLQIMAQIGSFVPAEYASFRIANQIFSRIGSDDDLETNSSTFMMEMKEINYIIQTVSANSLIIIDELGRGTSVEEGVGICFSICEHLIATKAFTFFVTHFRELTMLDSLYPNVENYFFEIHRSFSIEANCEKVVYTHMLSKGKTEEKHYGIQLAEISTLPQSVVTNAKQLAIKIEEEKKNSEKQDKEICRQRAVFKLATRLVQAARSSRLDDDSLRQYVASLKKKYEEEVLSLEE
ncbi:mutS protein homolog 4-like isoform X2 [Mercenaria mercenaria]|uniref:mutS protein homolog 4-like isoform X2 n=1 Tax=Mercenaria mercenaria TaxID=6596 RepID=UPI00234EE72B|nr:mutS protein homolog 4-like isoform X2 [Mercenaria mercenaria]